MTTNNRTNEDVATTALYAAEPDLEKGSAVNFMAALSRARTVLAALEAADRLKPTETKSAQNFGFTEAQVDAAAKAFYETPLGLTNWDRMADVEPDLAGRYRDGMARALVAAQDAAPQAERVLDAAGNEAQKCLRCGKYVFECCESFAPVLPSSTVDEDALAEVIRLEIRAFGEGPVFSSELTKRLTPAVTELWKEQGGGSRGE